MCLHDLGRNRVVANVIALETTRLIRRDLRGVGPDQTFRRYLQAQNQLFHIHTIRVGRYRNRPFDLVAIAIELRVRVTMTQIVKPPVKALEVPLTCWANAGLRSGGPFPSLC